MTRDPMSCGVFRVFLKSGGNFDVVCEDVRIARNPLNGSINNVSFVNVDESNPVPLYIETGSIAAIVAIRMPARLPDYDTSDSGVDDSSRYQEGGSKNDN